MNAPPQDNDSTLYHWKFRAEFIADVAALLYLIDSTSLAYVLITEMEGGEGLPDRVVEIKARELDRERLIGLMACLESSHVMMETLAEAAAYTGKREVDEP